MGWTSTSSTSSQHDDVLLLVVNHGWPGSIIEQLEDHRSTDRSHLAYGGSAADAFHAVIPSMPGYVSGQADEHRLGARSGMVEPGQS